MQKGGQITVFLLVGIIILVLAVTTFYLISYVQKERVQQERDLPLVIPYKAQISAFVESCLRETAIPGLFLLGRQGGRIYPERDNILTTTEDTISLAYLNGERVREKEDMEQDMNKFIEDFIETCTADFTSFQALGINIKSEEPEVTTTIFPEDIRVTLHYPLKIISGEDSFTIQDFEARLPVRLGKILSIEEEIITEHQQNPFLYDLSSYAQKEAVVVVLPFDTETTLFSIYDQKSILNDLPYYYWFAVRDERPNSPPQLEFVPNAVLTLGVPFEKRVDALDPENDRITFSTDNEHFPISGDGVFRFTPTSAGTFFITITAKDTQGNKDEQQVRFVVEEQRRLS